jgi:hypothetical protein
MPVRRMMRRKRARSTSRRRSGRKNTIYFARYRTPKRARQFTAARTRTSDAPKAIYDPFAQCLAPIRIPDGKTYLSIASRLQRVREIAMPQPAAAGGPTVDTIDVIVYPGVQQGFAAIAYPSTNAATPAVTVAGFNGNSVAYSGHVTVSSELGVLAPDNAVNQFRVVSQALRLSLINNANNNQGWWEAARVNFGDETSAWTLENHGGGDNWVAEPRFGALGGFQFAVRGLDLTNTPSYTSGKLRDIGDFIFKLKPNSDEHEYRTLNTQPQVTAPATLEVRNQDYRFIDSTYDAIVIRIHGQGSANNPTRLLAHCICNQELVYDETTQLSRFHQAIVHDRITMSAINKAHSMTPPAAANKNVRMVTVGQ